MDKQTHDQHPDWEEITCATCTVKAQGTPMQLRDWVSRHELKFNHQVIRK